MLTVCCRPGTEDSQGGPSVRHHDQHVRVLQDILLQPQPGALTTTATTTTTMYQWGRDVTLTSLSLGGFVQRWLSCLRCDVFCCYIGLLIIVCLVLAAVVTCFVLLLHSCAHCAGIDNCWPSTSSCAWRHVELFLSAIISESLEEVMFKCKKTSIQVHDRSLWSGPFRWKLKSWFLVSFLQWPFRCDYWITVKSVFSSHPEARNQ
jgi:hypothetical protein